VFGRQQWKTLAGLTIVASLAVLGSPAVATSAKAAPVVKAVIQRNLNITFSPATFKHGLVAIRITNLSTQTHRFLIGGVASTWVSPHRTVTVKVTFKKKATYLATLSDCGYLSLCVGGNPDIGPTGYVKVT